MPCDRKNSVASLEPGQVGRPPNHHQIKHWLGIGAAQTHLPPRRIVQFRGVQLVQRQSQLTSMSALAVGHLHLHRLPQQRSLGQLAVQIAQRQHITPGLIVG